MQERRIEYLESAIVDLENLSRWLLEVASERVADRYIDRIRERSGASDLAANVAQSGLIPKVFGSLEF